MQATTLVAALTMLGILIAVLGLFAAGNLVIVVGHPATLGRQSPSSGAARACNLEQADPEDRNKATPLPEEGRGCADCSEPEQSKLDAAVGVDPGGPVLSDPLSELSQAAVA